MSLLAYALTTVARLKTFLGISSASYDTLLENIVNSTSEFIEKYCDRRFKKTAYTDELYNGNGFNKLMLKNYPVDSSATFSIYKRDSIQNEEGWDDVDDEDYFVHWDKGYIENVRDIFYAYPKHYKISYTAGYNFNNTSTYLTDAGAGDLEYACWKLASKVFNQRNVAGNVQSESLGDYSISFMSSVMADPEIKSILDKYKRPFG
jgi:hypothetical protein